jgi:hypothetical protein
MMKAIESLEMALGYARRLEELGFEIESADRYHIKGTHPAAGIVVAFRGPVDAHISACTRIDPAELVGLLQMVRELRAVAPSALAAEPPIMFGSKV